MAYKKKKINLLSAGLPLSKCKNNCPHLNNRSVSDILAENDYLKNRCKEMERVIFLAEKKIYTLKEKIKLLEQDKHDLNQELNQAYRKPFKPNKKDDEIREVTEVKKGAPFGHPGTTRGKPAKIDEYVDVYPKKCRHCGSNKISNCNSFDKHIVEDIEINVKTTCFRKHYGYCKKCGKITYPESKEILPNIRIGPDARAISTYFRTIGIPFNKIQKIFNNLFDMKISSSSFSSFETKTAENGSKLYEQLKHSAKHSSHMHVDETGWRVNGVNHWLWCFTNPAISLYHIDRTRSSNVPKQILGEKYKGTLISDFYSAYNPFYAKAKQKCIAHLLRDLKNIEENLSLSDSDMLLCVKLKNIFKQAIKFKNKFKDGKKSKKDLKQYKNYTADKLIHLLSHNTVNEDLITIKSRLFKYNNELFTFLDNPEIEPTNNHAERQLRPNVIMRKITFGNRSKTGVRNHEVLMSIAQTAILQKKEPFDIFRSLLINDKQKSLLTTIKIPCS